MPVSMERLDTARCVVAATGLDHVLLARFAARQLSADPADVQITVRPLRRGLQSTAIAHVIATARTPTSRGRTTSFVVKRLMGTETREATLYADVLASATTGLAPRFLGHEQSGS